MPSLVLGEGSEHLSEAGGSPWVAELQLCRQLLRRGSAEQSTVHASSHQSPSGRQGPAGIFF